MEFEGRKSKIIFEEDYLTSEQINLKGEKKFLSIKYKNIKGVTIFQISQVQWLMYLIGVSLIIYGFSTKEKEALNRIYQVPATMEEIIAFGLFGIGCIVFGYYYFAIKEKNTKDIRVKYFEGKNKNGVVFTSEDENQINVIKKEIESRI